LTIMWFKNLKTVTKLILAFGLVAAILALVGYQGVASASSLNSMLEAMYQKDLVGLLGLEHALQHKIEIARDTRNVMLQSEHAAAEEKARDVQKDFVLLREEVANIEGTIHTDETRVRMTRIKELLPIYETKEEEAVQVATAGNVKDSMTALGNVQAVSEEISKNLVEMRDLKIQNAKKAYDESDAIYRKTRATLIAIMVIAVIFSMAMGFFIARLVSRPLADAVGVLESIANGDLTTSLELHTKDEMGRMAAALNRASESMRTALSEVRSSANSMAASSHELASSSEQLSAATEQLSSGAQEQASSLEETTSTLEEITSTVKQNADNAKQASQVAGASRDTAEKGGQVVSEAVGAMGQINASSKNITEIISTIDEIAFQTNLLALNAAVEAARAGEQGRGFAVVATEVRNLAQRSATSAKEIKRLIQDSVQKVENGSGLVTKSGETLQEIVISVKKVTDFVAEIAAASREQSTGIEQVNKAVQQMGQVTQNNAAQTEQLSGTAQSLSLTAQGLSAHAQQLQGLVGRFRVDLQVGRQGYSTFAPQPLPARPVAKTPTATTGHEHGPKPAATMAAAAGAGIAASTPKPNVAHAGDGSEFAEF